jgi:two-component system sporulation sensor kinase A
LNINEVDIFGKIKVLHIDDDELLLNTLKPSLETMNDNIVVDSESVGLRALEKIKDSDYDCVILDYLMPINNGLEIVAKIREYSQIPIILYTIRSVEDVSKVIFKKEIDFYIKKELNASHYTILEQQIMNLANKYRSEKIAQKIINNFNDFIVILDGNFNTCFYNHYFEKYVDETNFIGKSILSIIEDDDKEQVIDFLSNNDNKIDNIIINYNNDNRYVEIVKTKISDRSEYLILVLKDITTYIVKPENVSSLDTRFNAITNLSPDGIMSVSKFGYITYINPAFAKLTGYSNEEIVGKHLISLPTLRGRNIGPYLKLFKRFLSGKLEYTNLDFPYSRKDGTSGIGSAFANIIDVNGNKELITIIKDVTDKKKTEEEYNYIFNSSLDGIIHLDLGGTIIKINDPALNILDISSVDYIGKSIFTLESELNDDSINFIDIYNKLMLRKVMDPFEIKIKINDDLIWLEIKLSIVKAHDEALGIQIILRNITKQKNIENERIKYTANLEKLVEERTNQLLDNEKMFTLAKVTSMVGHDLKGPLQVISNSLHLIKLRPDNQEQYLEYIQKAIKQSNDLIQEMMQIGKEAPIKIEEVKIENILEESQVQIKVTDNISFETVIKTDKLIRLDKSKFIRVFNNLFKNAIEAMPNGGKITVKVEEKEDKFYFEIVDTGSGIPEEKIKSIFRPFQSSKSKGMGLGLSFCKNTVENHGGNISVESEIGKGTKFIIMIPRKLENYIEST